MQAVIMAILPNSSQSTILTSIAFIASFGLLLGFWGLKEVMTDRGGQGYLRKIGLLLLTVALAVRAASLAANFLTSVTLSYSPPEAITSGEAVNTAVMFLVIGGAIGIFATIITITGTAFMAISLMNADLIGADKPLAILLGVVPAVVASVILLNATLFEDAIFTLFLLGNLVVFVQVAWVILLGVALVRKSDSLAATSS